MLCPVDVTALPVIVVCTGLDPSPDFEYSLRLGFIRSQTSASFGKVDVAAKGKEAVLTLRAAAERFAESHRTKLAEIRAEETEWRRLRLNFPSIPGLYKAIQDSVFYEDLLSDEQLSKDFLIPMRYLHAYHQLSQNEIDGDNPFDDASEPSSLHSATEPSRS